MAQHASGELARVRTIGVKGEIAEARAILTGPLNTLLVADSRQHTVIVFDSVGRVVRRIGRRGNGPGEFAVLTGIAWKHDTLVVLDGYSKRLSFFNSNGKLTNTVPIQAEGRPAAIHSLNGKQLVVAMYRRPPGPTYKSVVPNTPVPRPRREFWVIESRGVQRKLEWANDTSPEYLGSNCEAANGWVFGVPHPFGHVGPQHAFLGGKFVLVSSNLLLVHSESGRSAVPLGVGPRLISSSGWAQLTRGFGELERKHGKLKCNSIPVRVPAFPLVRALVPAADGVLWVAVDADDGFSWLRWTAGHPRMLRLRTRPPDRSILAAARGDLLYLVREDEALGDVVDVYRLSR
jgi:hypothetical protein